MPHIDPEPIPAQYLQQQQQFHEQQQFQQQQLHEQDHQQQEEQQQPQKEEGVEYQDEFKNPVQGDWYVETATPEEDSYEYDEFENPAHYFDEEDEDIDPYYIADTKGRAKAFEGQVRLHFHSIPHHYHADV